jgi:hypothetical protein
MAAIMRKNTDLLLRQKQANKAWAMKTHLQGWIIEKPKPATLLGYQCAQLARAINLLRQVSVTHHVVERRKTEAFSGAGTARDSRLTNL